MISTAENIILDSNIWIALFYEKDSQHEKALRIFESNKENTHFTVTNYIDLECISVLLQKVSHESSAKWINFRKNTPEILFHFIKPNENEEITDLFLYLKNKHLSFIDVSLLYFAQHGYKILTLDTKLQRVIDSIN